MLPISLYPTTIHHQRQLKAKRNLEHSRRSYQRSPCSRKSSGQAPFKMAPVPRNNKDDNSNNYQHHCGLCNGAPNKRCFKQNHVAYCEACGDLFTVRSSKCGGGCLCHPYSKGYNLSYKKLKSKLPADDRSDHDLKLEAEAHEQMRVDAAKKEQVAAANEAVKKQQLTNREKKKLRIVQKGERYK